MQSRRSSQFYGRLFLPLVFRGRRPRGQNWMNYTEGLGCLRELPEYGYPIRRWLGKENPNKLKWLRLQRIFFLCWVRSLRSDEISPPMRRVMGARLLSSAMLCGIAV